MIRKKVCMLGAPGVGKTSLVRRYVDSLFDDRYRQTLGVRIDKKVLRVEERLVTLMLWDIHGEDDATPIRDSYLRGLDGYLLVLDGTRPDTVEMASRAHERVRALSAGRPYVLVLNKADLVDDRAEAEAAAGPLIEGAERVLWTSACTGSEVERCFEVLGSRLVGAADTSGR